MSSSSPCERDVRQQHIPYRQRQPLGTTGPPGCGYDPTYASSGAGINQAIGYCCGNSADLMHEVVLGSNVEIPVPIHTANNYLIANSTPADYSTVSLPAWLAARVALANSTPMPRLAPVMNQIFLLVMVSL